MSVTGANNGSIGLLGTIFTLVGFVVGASIYILPGQLFALAGPAMILSMVIASVPALFTCLLAAQVGSAFPGSGANFLATRAMLSPFWGFLTIWSIIGASVVALALLAYGFADYVGVVVPAFAPWRGTLACAVIGTFCLLNFLGAKEAAWFQTFVVVALKGSLVLFAVIGLFHIEPARFVPFAPQGSGAVMMGIVPSFFAFLGFTLIVAISEEIKDPGRTIPRALAWSFVIIMATYIAVSIVAVGTLEPAVLASSKTPIDDAAKAILPGWAIFLMSVGAVMAATTSINGVLLLVSRDVVALGRDGLLPSPLAELNFKAQVPAKAILFVAALAVACILTGASIERFAVTTVVGFLLAQSVIAVACWRMPTRLGAAFDTLPFKMSPFVLRLVCSLTILSCAAFLVISLMGSLLPALVAGLYLALGALWFVARPKNVALKEDLA
jgi:basic amino acid/polyamine antiporter, APA family